MVQEAFEKERKAEGKGVKGDVFITGFSLKIKFPSLPSAFDPTD